MAYIQLEKDISITKGNFSFLTDATGNNELFSKFYNAEKNLKEDYFDFAHKMRIAYEAFALYEEAKKRKENGSDKSIEELKELTSSEIKEPASIINYKNIIIELCSGRESDFINMLIKYSYLKYIDDSELVSRRLKKFIRYLYAFGSESSHENVNSCEQYVPNRENCLKVVGSLHDFLCVYYHVNKKYDSTLIPIGDYVPIPKKIVKSMGLSLDTGKYLFVQERKNKVSYYILSNDISSISNAQRRDIDTINKLWEENLGDPANIIRQTENIFGSNEEYKFQVYSLPSRPYKLTEVMIKNISNDDKFDIIAGLCRGVDSIHNYETPMFHRNICPDAFYIFNIRNKYKPLLAKFDCTKDTANSDFTVFQNVEKKIKNNNINQFFAPEVINTNMGDGVDWKKADIYSLAKTILYILTGKIVTDKDKLEVIEESNVDNEIKIILMEMLSEVPGERPELKELMRALENSSIGNY